MEIKVRGIERVNRSVDVEVDMLDFLDKLKTSVCHVPSDAFIKDGKVVTEIDVSMHGSSVYEYIPHEISDDDLEIMKKIDELRSLVSNKIDQSY